MLYEKRSDWFAVLVAMPLAWCALLVAPEHAAGQEETRWRTGALLHRHLRTEAGITWGGKPLRAGLLALAHHHRTPIMLDRRVDPGQRVDLAVGGIVLRDLYAEIAKNRQLALAEIGPVLYFGPTGDTEKLATLVEIRKNEIDAISAAATRKLSVATAWHWNDLTTPRDLIRDLTRSYGLTVVDLEESVPHDLWPAMDFPAMGFVERMTLLTAGFGMTFTVASDGTVRLLPLPDTVAVRREYRVGGNTEELARKMALMLPDGKFELSADKMVVAARVEEHEMIARVIRGGSTGNGGGTPTAGEKVYTLNVENKPAGAILKTLEVQAGYRVEYDRSLTDSLRTLVSFRVDNARIEQVLRKTLDPLGLQFALEGKTITVTKK
jgi:hypothetical protein